MARIKLHYMYYLHRGIGSVASKTCLSNSSTVSPSPCPSQLTSISGTKTCNNLQTFSRKFFSCFVFSLIVLDFSWSSFVFCSFSVLNTLFLSSNCDCNLLNFSLCSASSSAIRLLELLWDFSFWDGSGSITMTASIFFGDFAGTGHSKLSECSRLIPGARNLLKKEIIARKYKQTKDIQNGEEWLG